MENKQRTVEQLLSGVTQGVLVAQGAINDRTGQKRKGG